MRGGKGQYSLEFLVTYGWALLILGIVIGAIYTFGWVDPSNFMPQKCSFYGQVGCKDFYLSPDQFNLSLVNNFGVSLYIDSVAIVSDGQSLCNASNMQLPWQRGKVAITSVVIDNSCTEAEKLSTLLVPGRRADVIAQVRFFSNETCSACWTHAAGCDQCLHTATGRILGKVSR